MNLILLGAPGAGKGTQAELLVEKLSIPAISTGNMLREAMANGSDLGYTVKKIMDEGSLVPDDVILDIVEERVARPDCANGFILDGVPRTLAQAQALEARGIKIDHVISIEIDDDVVVGRMTGRRVCSKCSASYHIAANPPKNEGICDLCGGSLVIERTTLRRLSATVWRSTTGRPRCSRTSTPKAASSGLFGAISPSRAPNGISSRPSG